MLPPGFLGTRADILMDLVLLSFIVILPAICWSWWQVRQERYTVHKTAQVTLALVLALAVGLFEADLQVSGGIFVLTADSAYNGTDLLNSWIYGHTIVAILTTLIWVGLILFSLRRFPKPPAPGAFSKTHRFWGRTGMITMAMTGLSAFPLYFYGFMR